MHFFPQGSTILLQTHKISPLITCRVLHTKSLLSSPQTLCAATTNTSTRNTNTIDSQILPNAVEYLLTPLKRLSSPDQFITVAAALAWAVKTNAPCKRWTEEKRFMFSHSQDNQNKSSLDYLRHFLRYPVNLNDWLYGNNKSYLHLWHDICWNRTCSWCVWACACLLMSKHSDNYLETSVLTTFYLVDKYFLTKSADFNVCCLSHDYWFCHSTHLCCLLENRVTPSGGKWMFLSSSCSG